LQIETKNATLTIGNLRNKDITEYTQSCKASYIGHRLFYEDKWFFY